MEIRDLDHARAFVKEVATNLDHESRYISDLMAAIDRAKSLAELESSLAASSRGMRHSGADVFLEMSLAEKLLANLVTPETTLFRFSEGELEAIDRELLPALAGRTARVLIVPCSHGEEAFTIAAYFLKVRVPFEIRAFDVQPALIDEAHSGRLTFGYPIEFLAAPGRVSREVLDRIRFQVGDAFALPLGEQEKKFDLVLCRNFAGYFQEHAAVKLVRSLSQHVDAGGVLFLDSFCLGKLPVLETEIVARGARKLYGRPVFRF